MIPLIHRQKQFGMNPRRSRKGWSLFEATIAIALSATLLAGAIQLLIAVARQRRIDERRLLAIQEAGNLMEQVMLMPNRRKEIDNLALSKWFRASDPEAKLHVDIAPLAGEPQNARVVIEIRWRTSDRMTRDVRLVTWLHDSREPQP